MCICWLWILIPIIAITMSKCTWCIFKVCPIKRANILHTSSRFDSVIPRLHACVSEPEEGRTSFFKDIRLPSHHRWKKILVDNRCGGNGIVVFTYLDVLTQTLWNKSCLTNLWLYTSHYIRIEIRNHFKNQTIKIHLYIPFPPFLPSFISV